MSGSVPVSVRVSEGVEIGGARLVLIAGPCVIESRGHAVDMAGRIAEVTTTLDLPFIFKSSFDKANRTSLKSYRGPGLEPGLEILAEVRKAVGCPVTTDVHETVQVASVADVVDLVQVPALLCRQTDLLLAAGAVQRPVNIKKGQFMDPRAMAHAVDKVRSTGNQQVLVTERGSSFGYGNLVVDMRSLVLLRESCRCPVVMDATHAVQLPGVGVGCSGGERDFVRPLARAAAAVGIDALFLEVHDHPERALSDGPNSLRLTDLPAVLAEVLAVDAARRRCGELQTGGG